MTRPLPLFALALIAGAAHAQGTCDTAMPVDVGTYAVPGVTGTQVPVPVCTTGGTGATHGQWYAYVATADTGMRVTTDLPATNGADTRVHVYSGTCASLTCVGGDDDSGAGYTSVADFTVTAGNTYYIAFDDRYSNAAFSFQLLQVPPPPPPILVFTPQGITAPGLDYCVVDMNGDGLDDVVDVGATNIHVNYQQADHSFLETTYGTTPADHPASWSICAGDLDGNGRNDLMYGAGDGVTFMLANNDGTGFTELSFANYVFCQRTNMVDLNNDGHLDAFSCHDIDANVYFLNDGSNNFTFHQGGLGEDCGNYGSVWVDIDNDHDMDLFVAKCGCDPVDICYMNNGDGTFTNMASPLGFNDTQQSWSSAWADFDNDGDLDVIIGTSTGDYQKLMRNDGSTFTNVTTGSGLVSSVSNIDWAAHDFNNDGWVDILGYHTLFLNNGDMTFTAGPVAPQNGPIGDLNNDGYLDIQNGSMLYMNPGGTNHYLVVNTVGTLSNTNGIGARVQITSALGTQIRDVKSGDQFHYMSSLKTYFGLGEDTEVSNLTVYWPSGTVSSIDDPAIDGTITVVENEVSTGVDAHGANELSLYPSPATDVLHISAGTVLTNQPVVITDLAGQQVLRATLREGQVSVAGLAKGAYLVQVQDGKMLLNGRFVKE